MALTADRNTQYQNAEILSVPVAASTKVYAGGIAVANATGFAAGGAVATTLTYLGRFEETVDNSAGADGDLSVTIRRKKAFKWANSSTDAVTQAALGKVCYIEDDETVANTNGVNTRSAAGIVVQLDADGVWVE